MTKFEKQDLLIQGFSYIFFYSITTPIYILFYKLFDGVSGQAVNIIGSASWNNEPHLFYTPLIIVCVGKLFYHWNNKIFYKVSLFLFFFVIMYGVTFYFTILFTISDMVNKKIEQYHYYIPFLITSALMHIANWASKDDK